MKEFMKYHYNTFFANLIHEVFYLNHPNIKTSIEGLYNFSHSKLKVHVFSSLLMDDLHPSLFIIIYISLIFEKLLKKVLWMVGLYGSFYENSHEVCSPLHLVWSVPICDMTFQYNVVHSCVQSMLIFFSFDEQILLKCKLGILLCALVHYCISSWLV